MNPQFQALKLGSHSAIKPGEIMYYVPETLKTSKWVKAR